MLIDKERLVKSVKIGVGSFLVNLLIGWITCVFLLFLVAHNVAYFDEHNYLDFWGDIAFSVLAFVLPVLMSSIVGMWKFNTTYFI